MIELGAEALGAELAEPRTSPQVSEAWRDFLSSLGHVRDRGGRREAEQLAAAAHWVHSAVASEP